MTPHPAYHAQVLRQRPPRSYPGRALAGLCLLGMGLALLAMAAGATHEVHMAISRTVH